MDLDAHGGNKRVFQRHGGPPTADSRQKVCFHWRAGKCTRYQCPFLHRELPPMQAANGGGGGSSNTYKRGFGDDHSFTGPPAARRNPNFNHSSTWGRVGGNRVVRKTEKFCTYWAQGSCNYGDRCRFVHSWSVSESVSLLTQLEGHGKVVNGIALPSGSDKLYTGSKDETLRVWDCQSGQCVNVYNLGNEVGCMISEGPWIFVGLPHAVKAWDIQTSTQHSLPGPVGQVHALVVGNDLLFAGTQDGAILAWRYNAATNGFDPAASLTGHSLAVVSLVVGANRLCSGSMDKSIRVWSLETLQCMQILTEHTSVVMSMLCWDQFLLSCSLDQTIKVWVANDSGNLEVTYTHNEESVCFLCSFITLLRCDVIVISTYL
ncbi:zinc finger CCCH domain-containing protein 48 [Tripterygium wilfordii]|uniref:Zinc finger CCCH domain-containing protein 48 n=1 Tax=Tripterygium wilfordii TaxID=458696 RepID=A0A7J7CDY8_TRIWF|nr:zinc finger CCCH domain-containing protein 48 [Tripterygium wilfordii]